MVSPHAACNAMSKSIHLYVVYLRAYVIIVTACQIVAETYKPERLNFEKSFSWGVHGGYANLNDPQ